MDPMIQAYALLGAGIVGGCAAIGASVGNGMVTSRTVESVARQPELKGALQILMFISIGLIEALPIIAVVIAFLLYGIGSK
ncbi:MAG: F0F1 ATP synthase subunit C [Heliobacteriaceae bacterium]|nr:F0F1 ATP synthase subunit C [Heliobacteriaceae bacterium]MDD4587836.1 F0F1 ATP synthase subunit C [Heliobacteriaceae bacterium]